MAPFNHFDFLAPYYDRFVQPRDTSRFAQLAKLPASGVLIDVGGGTGQKSLPFLTTAEKVIIVDSSLGMLSQARQKSGLFIVCSESEYLPFASDTIDSAMMVDAFHHVRNHRQTAEELWRVIKPGGRIIIEEPDIRSISVKIMAVIEKIVLMRSHFVSRRGIAAFFEVAGAKVEIVSEDSTAWVIIDKQAD